MKKIVVIILIVQYGFVFGQKRSIDGAVIDGWPRIGSAPQISNNGRFLAYNLVSVKSGKLLVVQDTGDTWKKVIPQYWSPDNYFSELDNNYEAFTPDNHYLIFNSKSRDSVGLLDLQKNSLDYIPHATNFRQPKDGSGRWLACSSTAPAKAVILADLWTGRRTIYENVSDYIFNDQGRELAMCLTLPQNKSRVILVHLDNNRIDTICRDLEVQQFLFNKAGTGLVFLGKKERINRLMYWSGADSAITLAGPGKFKNKVITDIADIGTRADKIFINLDSVPEASLQDDGSNPTLWHYRDKELRPVTRSMAAITLKSPFEVTLFESKHSYEGESFDTGANSDYAACYFHTYFPNTAPQLNVHLVSLKDGTDRLLYKTAMSQFGSFSTGGRYYVWFDEIRGQWLSHNILAGSTKNITPKIAGTFSNRSITNEVIGWLTNDQSLLVYDQYSDIWKLDPDGKRQPVNLTAGYANKHGIRFTALGIAREGTAPINTNEPLLLTGFNENTKESHFYSFDLLRLNGPQQFDIGRGVYYYNEFHALAGAEEKRFAPVKARNSNVYIVKHMSATEYPNLLLTTDFKYFKNITNLAPQKAYNWYTTDLRHYKMPNHLTGQGILYKPENFDPGRKYPVIFYYYEKHVDMLNVFLHPEYSRGTTSIPWYVSNGYLVFVPDIQAETGHPGTSANNSVVAAAKYLATLSYVDSRHMGIQGHSYGGYETDYIVTRTHLFAAAAPANGVSDIIGDYAMSEGKQGYYETGQGRIGVPFWKNPQLYLDNSPVTRVDQITTPMFILHNSGDRIVAFQHGQELFNDLARLGKKAWLVSYDGEGHSIEKLRNRIDYSIRLQQFFDHYLKGLPAPLWMTQGTQGSEGLKLGLPGAKP